ncbi:hypothetical protein [Streptomyces sp. NPDC101455]|uniref:hypothetical protein n=1 Tax=Streptomyces sp. NPDC101455 TaxID=3366142 RepID=UPI0038116C63
MTDGKAANGGALDPTCFTKAARLGHDRLDIVGDLNPVRIVGALVKFAQPLRDVVDDEQVTDGCCLKGQPLGKEAARACIGS